MEQLKILLAWFKSRSPLQKIGILGGAAVLTIGLITTVTVSLSTAYAPLYYNLPSEEAANVVDYLQRNRIPYRLTNSGQTVKVAKDDVYEIRLKLAGSQIMRGGVGFEIFDKTNLGVTEFVQNINFQRALQGELARTINEIKQIESARVHLVLPKKTLFTEDQQDATCSVILKLHAGARLRSDQVEGIMALVAGSVAGLEQEKVTVLDTFGTTLSKDLGKRPGQGRMSVNEMNFRKQYESNLEERLQSMLERVVGRRNVVVRVSADLDFNKVEKTEELFDPDQVAIRSEHLLNEKTVNQEAGAGGVPGTSSNVPGKDVNQSAGSGRRNNADKLDELRNYEISKLVSRTVMPVGAVKKVSVAVMVDGRYVSTDESKEKTYSPRSETEILIYTNMVKKAIGFNKKRGDQVEVATIAFNNESLNQEVEELNKANRYSMIFSGLKYLGIALAALFFYFKILKPGLRFLASSLGGTGLTKSPDTDADKKGFGEMADQVSEKVEINRQTTVMDQVTNFASESPEEVAKVVKVWLKEQTA
ncbi:MAG: flagellar basal-body MS-ring/collar protein FliF [Pseudomonadota bacterium]|nr:flagellar basal-body MS-ring/collar protein FliF [Pseudomonadota bacterium]